MDLDDLVARGLRAPVLAIIDGNAGLRRAVGLVWPRVAVQRCCVHKLRNLTRKAPKHALDEIRDAFHRIAYAASADAARVAYGAFERADTVVLPISVDSVPTLKEYKTKYAMRQDLLSDFKRDVSRAYGTLLQDRFFSTRAYFLIDKQGILRWQHIEAELGARRDDAELLRQIESL